MREITELCEEFLDEMFGEETFRARLAKAIVEYEVEVAECLKNYLR